MFKAFEVTEKVRFDFRLETFNTFNHTAFNNPSTSVTATDFGQISSTGNPRTLQLGAKFQF